MKSDHKLDPGENEFFIIRIGRFPLKNYNV